MVSASYRNRTVRRATGAMLVAAVLGVTGCSDDSDSEADKKPAASKSSEAEADPEKTEKPEGENGSDSADVRQDAPEQAVETWVTAVIQKQPAKACLVMAEPAKGSTPAEVGSPELCNATSGKGQKIRESTGRFNEAFTPKGATGKPTVEAAPPTVNGDKAVIPANKITVNGQPLDKVILSNSTGLKPGDLDVNFETTKIKDAWYVTNLDFNIG